MAKISDLQKAGLSILPKKTEPSKNETNPGMLHNVVLTADVHASELSNKQKELFRLKDEKTDKFLQEDLPKGLRDLVFSMTDQSFTAVKTFCENSVGINKEDLPEEQFVYESEKDGVKYYYTVSANPETENAKTGLVRMRSKKCVERLQWSEGSWCDDTDLQELFDVMRSDEYVRNFILDTERRMYESILMTPPKLILCEVKNAEPLLNLEHMLMGCATIKSIFRIWEDSSVYDREDAWDISSSYFLAPSNPMISGSGVLYQNGVYSLCVLYAPESENDGLILYAMDEPENCKHIWHTVYKTKNPDDLILVLYKMWTMPDHDRKLFTAPLSENSCISADLNRYGQCISMKAETLNPDGNLNKSEEKELDRITEILTENNPEDIRP